MSDTWHDRDLVFDGETGWDDGDAVPVAIAEDAPTAEVVTGSGLHRRRRMDYVDQHLELEDATALKDRQETADDFDDGQKTTELRATVREMKAVL